MKPAPPIYRINASGGTRAAVTRIVSATEQAHRWPQFLPDDRHFVFMHFVFMHLADCRGSRLARAAGAIAIDVWNGRGAFDHRPVRTSQPAHTAGGGGVGELRSRAQANRIASGDVLPSRNR